MIEKIYPKTGDDAVLILDKDGRWFEVAEQCLAETADAHRDALAHAAERWELVDEAHQVRSQIAGRDDDQPVATIVSIEGGGDNFLGRVDNGENVQLAVAELKTLIAANDIRNAKLRGVPPPES